MTTLLPVADLDTFVSTRDSLHRVAEHVVAKARYVDDREIRLTAFLGIEPGFPRELYEPATTFDPDQPLDLDRSAAEVLAAWYGFTAEVLDQFASEIPEATPSTRILWPEHFDQAFYTADADEARRANYGASPGDEGHPEPYLYVGPLDTIAANDYWNAAHFNGAVFSLSQLLAAADPSASALQFLRTGRTLLAHAT